MASDPAEEQRRRMEERLAAARELRRADTDGEQRLAPALAYVTAAWIMGGAVVSVVVAVVAAFGVGWFTWGVAGLVAVVWLVGCAASVAALRSALRRRA